jgi:hypothetical protein
MVVLVFSGNTTLIRQLSSKFPVWILVLQAAIMFGSSVIALDYRKSGIEASQVLISNLPHNALEPIEVFVLVLPVLSLIEVLLSDAILPVHHSTFVFGLIPMMGVYLCCFVAGSLHWSSSIFYNCDVVVQILSFGELEFVLSPRGMAIGACFVVLTFCARMLTVLLRSKWQGLLIIKIPYDIIDLVKEKGRVRPFPREAPTEATEEWSVEDEEPTESKEEDVKVPLSDHEVLTIAADFVGFSIYESSWVLIDLIADRRIAEMMLRFRKKFRYFFQFFSFLNLVTVFALSVLNFLDLELPGKDWGLAVSFLLSLLSSCFEFLCGLCIVPARKSIRSFQFWFIACNELLGALSLLSIGAVLRLSVFTTIYIILTRVIAISHLIFCDALVSTRFTKVIISIAITTFNVYLILIVSLGIGIWSKR